MKLFYNLLVIIIVVILQTTLAPDMNLFGAFPNLIMIVMLSLLFIGRTEDAIWWAGIGGILLDIFSPVHFGVYTISFTLVIALNYYLVNYIFTDPTLPLAGTFIFVSSLIINFIFLLYSHYYGQYFLEAIYNTFVGCIIYSLIRYYYKPREEVKL